MGDSPENSLGYSWSSFAQRLLAASELDLNAPSCTPKDPGGLVEACALDPDGAFDVGGFEAIFGGAVFGGAGVGGVPAAGAGASGDGA